MKTEEKWVEKSAPTRFPIEMRFRRDPASNWTGGFRERGRKWWKLFPVHGEENRFLRSHARARRWTRKIDRARSVNKSRVVLHVFWIFLATHGRGHESERSFIRFRDISRPFSASSSVAQGDVSCFDHQKYPWSLVSFTLTSSTLLASRAIKQNTIYLARCD